jgi:hypothetical protein
VGAVGAAGAVRGLKMAVAEVKAEETPARAA